MLYRPSPLEGHGGKTDDGTQDASLVSARGSLNWRLLATGTLRLRVLGHRVIGGLGLNARLCWRAGGLFGRAGRGLIRVAEVVGQLDTVIGGAGLGIEALP